MLSGTTILSILLAFLAVALQDSGCQSYQMGSYPLSANIEDRQIFRRDHAAKSGNSAAFPKLTSSDIFGSSSDESSDRNRLQEENDSSASSDEASMLELSQPSQMAKRRKGPTLSVVNPLEILRQRLMLDLARRRIHENQQQIVANAEFLENIGKRGSSSSLFRQAEEGSFHP